MFKTRQAASVIVVWVGLAAVAPEIESSRADAQAPAETPSALTPRERIEAEFQRDLARVEGAKIARLAALAGGQPQVEANRTYADLFRFAIATGLYADAEPIAEGVLRSGQAPAEVALLAEMVNIVAEANRGAYPESLESLAAAIQIRQAAGNDPVAKIKQALPLQARLSLVNVYTQRLIQAARYDVARQALTMIRDTTKEAAVKSLANGRLAQLGLVGKPAPPIAGIDLDGKAESLAAHKGEVVLVVFWATWCLPNAREAARFEELADAYRVKGFRVLGINLDSLQDGGVPVAAVLLNVRRFLIEHNVRTPTLLNGTGDHDYARAYGVTEIPANVLIGRDGAVIHLDVNAANLQAVLEKVLAE